jgi:polyribonucleotide nucleotidyltransferase
MINQKMQIRLNSGYTFTITHNDLAPRSQSSVTVRCGDVVLLVTANFSSHVSSHLNRSNHCPLQVFYIEKMYAAGKIPGSFTRREGKPTDREHLYSRIIDRSLRPFFTSLHLPYDDLQLVITLLSYDISVDNVDVLSIYGACAALRILGINCKVGGVRVALIDGEYVINPSLVKQENAQFNILVSTSINGGESGTVMIEMGSNVTNTTQAEIIQAVRLGNEHISTEISVLEDFVVPDLKTSDDLHLVLKHREQLQQILKPYQIDIRTHSRDTIKLQELTETILTSTAEELHQEMSHLITSVARSVLRKQLLEGLRRIDSRANDEIRPIDIKMNVLPSVHGSALFRRGLTHALGVVTIGTESESQIVEAIDLKTKRNNFIFHYNFPHYCTGETGKLGFIRRREIGHGYVARKAIIPSLPSSSQSTIRVVTEILSADGSTSMASTCAASLALRNAGIQTSSLVAGIAMGVIWNHDDKRFIVLTDINAAEDNISDCDLKVTGTVEGITALQLDIHGGNNNLSLAVLERSLTHSRIALDKILNKMKDSVENNEISSKIPNKHILSIDHSHIKFVIGKAGSNIKKIMAESQCRIDIDDEKCEVHIIGDSQQDIQIAIDMIKEFTSEFKVDQGQQFSGKIVKIFPIGCFVNLGPRKDGFISINEFHGSIPTLGTSINVRVASIENNKIQLVLDK